MSLASIHDRLTKDAVAIQLPIGAENDFNGVVDLVAKKAYKFEGTHGEKHVEIDIPADMESDVLEYRATLMEKVAECDEDLLDAYLENGALTDEQLIKGIRIGTTQNKIYPVLCGSSLKNVGVQLVLDAVVKREGMGDLGITVE